MRTFSEYLEEDRRKFQASATLKNLRKKHPHMLKFTLEAPRPRINRPAKAEGTACHDMKVMRDKQISMNKKQSKTTFG